MKKTIYILFSTLFLFGCQSNENTDIQVENLLYKSDFKFLFEDNENIDNDFENENLKVEYKRDTIYAQAVQYVNNCGHAIPWVEIIHDTLILTTKELRDTLCNSAKWNKYQYWIKNPKNKKYVVIQKE